MYNRLSVANLMYTLIFMCFHSHLSLEASATLFAENTTFPLLFSCQQAGRGITVSQCVHHDHHHKAYKNLYSSVSPIMNIPQPTSKVQFKCIIRSQSMIVSDNGHH